MVDFLSQEEVDALLRMPPIKQTKKRTTKQNTQQLVFTDIFEYLITIEATFRDEHMTKKTMSFTVYELNAYRARRIAEERMLGMHFMEEINRESIKVLSTATQFKISGKAYEYVGHVDETEYQTMETN